MDFKTWIKKYKSVDNSIGDLAREILNDENFPKSRSRKLIKNYLVNHPCRDEIPDVFDEAFSLYLVDRH